MPTVNYTFNTDVGNNGTIDETAVGGITLAPKPAAAGQLKALTLDGDPATESHAPVLKEAALQKLVDQAIKYWAQQGADEDQIALLSETQVQISDLDGNKLAAPDAAGNLVTIDDDAAGYGWSLRLGEVNPPKVDLLSSLTHEFGHMLGYDHGVMDADLAVGEREMPLDHVANNDTTHVSVLGVNDQHVSSSEISAHLISEGAGRAFDLSFNSSGATQTDVAKPNIFGSEFSDALNGDSSRNIIFGDGGNYTINGGNGNDWLCGDGSDTFHFNAVTDALAGLVDTISDFELTIDDIDPSPLTRMDGLLATRHSVLPAKIPVLLPSRRSRMQSGSHRPTGIRQCSLTIVEMESLISRSSYLD